MPEVLLLRGAGSILRTADRPGGVAQPLPLRGVWSADAPWEAWSRTSRPGCVSAGAHRCSLPASSLTDGHTLSKEALSHALDLSSPEKANDAQPNSAEEALWTTRADGRVRLRLDPSCPQQRAYTVHQMFCRALDQYGHLPALGYKRQGSWERVTYAQYYLQARRAAKGFLKTLPSRLTWLSVCPAWSFGLERAHSVAILGFNSPEWFFSAVGTVFAGGIVTGIYTTSSPQACRYIARDSRANIIVVDAQKQLEKILKGALCHLTPPSVQSRPPATGRSPEATFLFSVELRVSVTQIWQDLPHLKAVVMYGEPPVGKVANVYTMEELMELGGQVPEEDLDAVLSTQQPNQCCALVYTSGTTGSPKGVMLSQDNITWTARYGSQAGSIQPAEVQQEVVVSYLPLSHIAAQIYDLWTGIQWGAQVCFAQPDALKGSLVDTLREVEPTSHMGVPRVWEKIMERIQEVVAQSGFIRRKMLLWAMSVMLEHNLSCPSSDLKPFAARLADHLVLAKVRQALGFAKCQKSFYGAAPMAAETQRFFLGLDIRLYSGYGLSETSGPHFMSSPCNFRLYSSGKVVPGCRAKLVNQDAEGIGEICMWGRTVSSWANLNMRTSARGHRRRRLAAQRGPRPPGRRRLPLHHGASQRPGVSPARAQSGTSSPSLSWVERAQADSVPELIKELIITAGGENVPPVPIEEAVKTELPLISSAVLIGDQRKFLSMLLTLKQARLRLLDEAGAAGPAPAATPAGAASVGQARADGLRFAVHAGPGHLRPDRHADGAGGGVLPRVGSRATRVSDIVGRRDEAVYRAIEEGIRRVNGNAAARPYHIQKWAILERDFSISGGELGPTMKLKRPAVLEKYKDVIDSFYLE
ncbi:hypothetical protein QTO34_012671 [Cnephaeus nilssonii]|uniref:Long-chain-fatty-acid--CoA ligase ACSBG1 n=1 Tax=Cnephaeus nilssonii TaxID=3371016 RepID=A0AA40LDQ8_CNENI|nr:hypothetical protein QTO34_012671 [Eptesicus nilssonii]